MGPSRWCGQGVGGRAGGRAGDDDVGSGQGPGPWLVVVGPTVVVVVAEGEDAARRSQAGGKFGRRRARRARPERSGAGA